MNEVIERYAELVPALMTFGALLIVSLEWVGLGVLRRIERHREGVVNVLCGVLSFVPVFTLSTLFTLALMFWLYDQRVLELGLEWQVWALAYVCYDLTTFMVHWASHKVRLLWCIHSVHHAPREMKASVAFRGSFADFLVTPHATLWLPLLGFHPLMVVLIDGVAMMWGVLLHLNERALPRWDWPRLRRVLITPQAHRLHHAHNDLYLDTNYGLTFSIWDHLIGSYQERETSASPVYGLRREVASDRLLASQLDEFRALWDDMGRVERLRDKLGYLVMPPGWRHDGGGETAAQIRRSSTS